MISIRQLLRFRLLAFTLLLLSSLSVASCQDSPEPYDFQKYYRFSQADTLRGAMSPLRDCYDVAYYRLEVKVDPKSKTIAGQVGIFAKATRSFTRLQIDLFPEMNIKSIKYQGKKLDYEREHAAVFIDFPEEITGEFVIDVSYHGTPIVAEFAPWDGGFIWAEDDNDNPWIGVACEGMGASSWWPNKDHLSDEPDSMDIIVEVPSELMCVSNGDLMDVKKNGKTTTYHWKVDYPINNYNVTLNIADYVHFSDEVKSQDGEILPIDYYVLRDNEEKAKEHFAQTAGVLEAFEHWFGPYPFWNDGFALVETPYLGMEHQSAIAYGNNYKRGYLGRLKPDELNFDYIIVHEAGHEWWGNSVSCKDHAEMWIHESYTTYMEALYVEYHHGYDMALRYLYHQKSQIANRQPIVGPLHVNFGGWRSSDHYYKGAWVLHSMRHSLPEGKDWREYLQALYHEFEMGFADTEEIIAFSSDYLGRNYEPFFRQYLYHQDIPVLQYDTEQRGDDLVLSYRWETFHKDFDMDFQVQVAEQDHRLSPTTEWQEITIPNVTGDEIIMRDDLYLIDTDKVRR